MKKYIIYLLTYRRKLRQLKKHKCSESQIKALMRFNSPVLWAEDEHGVLQPLDGRRYSKDWWFPRMLRKATFRKIG